MGEGPGGACLRNQKMSGWKRSLCPREQWRISSLSDLEQNPGVQTPGIPLLSAVNHEAHRPAVPLSHCWSARKRMTTNCCPLLHCSGQRYLYRLLLHYPCVHHFDFCFLWQLSKKILQTFIRPLTHNTVKNIVQAATKASSSKSRKTWNKNQLGDGKPYGLCTHVTPHSLWFLMHHLPTPLSCSTYSIDSGQVASSWTQILFSSQFSAWLYLLDTPDLLWKTKSSLFQ